MTVFFCSIHIYLFNLLFLFVLFCDVFGSFFLQFNRIDHMFAGIRKNQARMFHLLLTIGLVPCFSEL